MPTTLTYTIKPDGTGDYTTINAAEAALRQNLVSGDKLLVLEVYSGGNALSAGVTFDTGWTTDATRYIVIRAASGHEHAGVYDTNKAYGEVSGANSVAVYFRKDYCRLEKMQLKTTGTSSSAALKFGTSNQGLLVDRCLLINSAGEACVRLDGGGGTVAHVIRSSILLNSSGGNVGCNCNGVVNTCVAKLWNCTIHAATGSAIAAVNGANCETENCYLSGTTCYSGGTFVKGDHDACVNTEAVTASLDSIAYSTANFVNVTGAGADLKLAAGSALVNVGEDLSSKGFTDDIVGELRGVGGTWDIGAHELLISSAGVAAGFKFNFNLF